MRLWSGQAPGTENWSAAEEEADVTLPGAGKIHVITNVTVPRSQSYALRSPTARR
jgi:hypothetical protein